MGKDLTKIRETIEWSMKEMARLKDHVNYQLDLQAPFAFLFNQITQDLGDCHQTLAARGGPAAVPTLCSG